MSTALVPQSTGAIAEQVAIVGDLAKLSPEQRMNYYGEVCRSLGLNPLSRPFQYITLNQKLTLYATRDATDQLRKIHGVSIAIAGRERIDDVYVVTARATTPDGRSDESTGVVVIGALRGEALANALMKAETKAKRRVTLSIVGLGWIEESELDTVRTQPNEITIEADEAQAIAAQRNSVRTEAITAMRNAAKALKAASIVVDMPTREDVEKMSLDGILALTEAWESELSPVQPAA